MNRAIERRLSSAERRVAETEFALNVIVVHGGLQSGDPIHAVVGAQYLERQPTESYVAFEARVIAIATAARVSFVVIGGLPPTLQVRNVLRLTEQIDANLPTSCFADL